MTHPMIEIRDLTKRFGSAEHTVTALENVSLKIETGDIYGIIGLSGAGKSTLVRCINLLELPTKGQVFLDGRELTSMTPKELRSARRSMGMIFQGFHLLMQRTALENICFPLELEGVPKKEARARAEELLAIVGLADRASAYPAQLSGGQKQRVAIARAIANKPKVLLCDEATSALDPNTTRSILELLREINRTMGVTIVIITHEMKVVEQVCNRVAVLDQSHVVEDGAVKDIFLAPKSRMARELILPKEEIRTSIQAGKKIRIVFDGNSAFEPVISNLTLACRSAVNILGADTKNMDGKAYGQMLLQLPEEKKAEERILCYLTTQNIHFEEVGDV